MRKETECTGQTKLYTQAIEYLPVSSQHTFRNNDEEDSVTLLGV